MALGTKASFGGTPEYRVVVTGTVGARMPAVIKPY